MPTPRPRGTPAMIGIVFSTFLALLVAYALSLGPVIWLVKHQWLPGSDPFWNRVYEPLEWVGTGRCQIYCDYVDSWR